jgi:hypothetical protein
MPLQKPVDRLVIPDLGADAKALRTLRDLLQAGWTQLVRLQDALAEWVRQAEDRPLYGARVITASVGTSNTVVYHGLGRLPQGWIVAARNANTTVWAPAAAPATSTTLTLIAGSAVTLTLVVF